MNKIRPIGLLLAVFALAAIPAMSQASNSHSKGHSKSTTHCTLKRAFTVRGTLDGSFTPIDGKTADSIDITVTSANRHARNSGELTDQDATKPGVQVKGGSYSVSGDTFKYKLVSYETGEVPATGDRVKLVGKIAYTKKKCAPDGTSLADRYGDVNIRKAVIKDADGD